MSSIVVFASGRGSNFDSIEKAIHEKRLKAELLAVISDQPEAPVLNKARKLGIPVVAIPFPKGPNSIAIRRQEHEEKVKEQLDRLQPKFLVMAGYMRILSSRFLEGFRSEKGHIRIVNIHPSILPAFPGTHSYAQAFQYGAKVAGVTVHLVETEVDSGPICAQETFSIEDCRTEAEVEQRGLEVEHRLYPKTLNWILEESFVLEPRLKGRFYVRQN